MRFVHISTVFLGLVTLVSFEAEARHGRSCGGFYGPMPYQMPYYAPSPGYMPSYHAPYAYGPPAYSVPLRSQPSFSAPPPIASSPSARTAEIGAYDNYFRPQTITVPPGTTVRWTNAGQHSHTVTADDGSWDSGDLPPSRSYEARFDRPGTYYYYCKYHTDDRMRGTIVVGRGGSAPGGAYGGSQTPGY